MGAADELRKIAAQAAAAHFQATMRHQGWARVHCRQLDVDILVVGKTVRAPIPPEDAALPHFTLDEFLWIGQTKPPLDRLRAIVDAKREMPGVEIAMDVT